MTGRLDRSGGISPALGYGPLGPRLRNWTDRDQIAAPFAEPLRAMVAEMRPFTAFVVIGLVVLIVVAFAVKLATTGLAP